MMFVIQKKKGYGKKTIKGYLYNVPKTTSYTNLYNPVTFRSVNGTRHVCVLTAGAKKPPTNYMGWFFSACSVSGSLSFLLFFV